MATAAVIKWKIEKWEIFKTSNNIEMNKGHLPTMSHDTILVKVQQY